jgi:hypothetical protein
MELSTTREATGSAATLELPSFPWNSKVHYRGHKSLPQVPNLSYMNPLHTTPFCHSLRSILILFTRLRLGFPSGLFPSGFNTNILYSFLFSPVVLHVLPISFSLTWSFDLAKSTSYETSLCSSLQLPVTSSLFSPNILFNTLFSNILSLCSSLNVRDQKD